MAESEFALQMQFPVCHIIQYLIVSYPSLTPNIACKQIVESIPKLMLEDLGFVLLSGAGSSSFHRGTKEALLHVAEDLEQWQVYLGFILVLAFRSRL